MSYARHPYQADKPFQETLSSMYFPKNAAQDFTRIYFPNTATEIGVCEVMGHRHSQEDAIDVDVPVVAPFAKALNVEKQKLVLSEAMRRVQATTGTHVGGATATCAIAWLDESHVCHVTTANIGDSSTYRIIVKMHGEIDIVKLTTNHNPDQPQELSRIKLFVDEDARAMTGYILSDDKTHGVNVSRSLGDREYEGAGLIHIPDIVHHTKHLARVDKAYIVVACDGFDVIGDKLDVFKKVFKSILDLNLSLGEMANRLVVEALEKDSTDNITLAIFAVGAEPISASVFDGHGGAQVSKQAAQAFYAALHSAITIVLKPEGFLQLKIAESKESIKLASMLSRKSLEKLAKTNQEKMWLPSIKALFSDFNLKYRQTSTLHVFTREQMFANTTVIDLIFAADSEAVLSKVIDISQGVHFANTYTESDDKDGRKNYADDDHPKKARLTISFSNASGKDLSMVKKFLQMTADRLVLDGNLIPAQVSIKPNSLFGASSSTSPAAAAVPELDFKY